MLTRVRGHRVAIGTTPTGFGTRLYVGELVDPTGKPLYSRTWGNNVNTTLRCAPATPAGLGRLLTALDHLAGDVTLA